MVQPINYQLPVPDPFAALTQGLNLGLQMEQAQAAIQQRQAQASKLQAEMLAERQKAEQQQKLNEAYTTLVDKVRAGTWQPADFQSVALLAPKEQSEAAIKFFDTLSKDRQAQTLASTTQVMAALGSKNPEIGIELLNQRAQGYRTQGNEDQAKFLETQAKLAAIDPAIVISTLGETLYGLPGGKDAVDALAKMNEERRAAALAPAELAKAKSEAEKASIEAKYAEREKRANLALTAARTAEARASAIPGDVRTALWYQTATPAQKAAVKDFEKVRQEAQPPKYDVQAGGFIVPPTDAYPQGRFIPLRQVASEKEQSAALKALRTAGYNPETGEDRISELIKRSTGGLAQTFTAKSLEVWNISTSGQKAIGELQAASNAISTDILGGKLGAGISNADREFILASLGDVGNSLLSTGRRLQAWSAAKNRMITSGMVPPPTKEPKQPEQIRSPEEVAPAAGRDIGGGFRLLD